MGNSAVLCSSAAPAVIYRDYSTAITTSTPFTGGWKNMNSHTRSPSHHNTWPTVTLRHLHNLSCQEGSLVMALNPVLHNGKWVGWSRYFCIYSLILFQIVYSSPLRHSVVDRTEIIIYHKCVLDQRCLGIKYNKFCSSYKIAINNNNMEQNGREIRPWYRYLLRLLSPIPNPALWHQKWIPKWSPCPWNSCSTARNIFTVSSWTNKMAKMGSVCC